MPTSQKEPEAITEGSKPGKEEAASQGGRQGLKRGQTASPLSTQGHVAVHSWTFPLADKPISKTFNQQNYQSLETRTYKDYIFTQLKKVDPKSKKDGAICRPVTASKPSTP